MSSAVTRIGVPIRRMCRSGEEDKLIAVEDGLLDMLSTILRGDLTKKVKDLSFQLDYMQRELDLLYKEKTDFDKFKALPWYKKVLKILKKEI